MLLLLIACGRPEPTAELPSGGFFSSTGASLGMAAQCLVGFPNSPASQAAPLWGALAQSCPGEVYGTGALAAFNLQCGAPPPEVLALRGSAAVAFGAPRTESGVIHGTLSAPGDHGWQGEVRIPIPANPGAFSLLVPAAEGPGPNVLTDHDALVHARVRAESGIDIASLVPAQSQADSLFNLKSSLLSRAVLAGTWELAIYPAPKGQVLPQAVLAIGVHASAARPAVDAFASQLREQWNVQRAPTAVGNWHGECIRGMRILPGLEPCWLMDEQSLVVGWNQQALVQAVGGTITPIDLGGRSGITLDFRAMSNADAILAADVNPALRFDPIRYPTNRATFTAARQGDLLVAHLDSDQPCGP